MIQMWVVYKRSQDKLEARRKLAGGFADAT
jgi:hypothetical protein